TSPEVFARELLKLVLFHEVGHAMGLAHNFKGSLSWNPDDAATPVTTSVMDYNQYQLEGALFTSETSSDGMIAEYDRQVISVLYNEGKDVLATDAVVPACDDEAADDYDGGVDPLCMRYDAGHDPTMQLTRTIALVKDEAAKLGRSRSLPATLGDLKAVLGDATVAATEADVSARLAEVAKQTVGVLAHYYASGAQSIAYMAKSDVKMLYVLKDDVLPAPYDAKAMLARSLEGIRTAVNMTGVETVTEEAIDALRTESEAWVKATPWYAGLSVPDKDAGVTKKLEVFGLVDEMMTNLILPKMRAAIMGTIVFKDSVPFMLSLDTTPSLDVEKAMMDLLEQAVTSKMADGEYRPMAERALAATALRTFTPVPGSDVVYARVAANLGGEMAGVQTASERAELRALLKVVQTEPAAEEEEEAE
ncbi:MAG: zinc-dependent metalloprotease, partial [Bdellovibrionota bacterium]